MVFLSRLLHILPALWLAVAAAAEGGPPSDGPTTPAAFSRFQMLVIVHALLSTLGFAVLLPAGALLARYLRTFRPWWYSAHWIVQLALAGPVVAVGVGLGFLANHEYGDTDSPVHPTLGKFVLGLYVFQCVLGAVIHYIKPASAVRRRPAQNYAHGVLGLLVVGIGMYQIRTGYADEWPRLLRYGSLPGSVNTLWIVWCVILPVVYAGGLALLPKQYRQEADARYRSVAPDDKAHELHAMQDHDS
ncbi:hypothetical protein B0H15DRAFT_917752 [Mycena belliarum]|uniref:Cytochrome b561 domain-containing protein n=1 Tax=Mycena belliarum TaxID=1033014 RepID=A0AAD6TMH8_9AGAR|nr:hypothetical protein B0H15DRAFT_917752 [Mycena belliae]